MITNVTRKSQKVLRAAQGRATPALRGLRAKHDAAFAALDAQVQVAKRSAVAQLAVGGGVIGLTLTGHFGPAAGLLGAWIGSRPLTHVVAAGLACIAALDEAIEKGVTRLQCEEPDVPSGPRPRTRRHRPRNKVQAQVAAAPAGM